MTTTPGTDTTPPATAGPSTTAPRRVRVGIDVGGTFTHAVAIDTADFAIVAETKVPTTHRDPRGVAAGIVESLFKLLETGGVAPAEVAMIAHSTTQATNALLEGDVAVVGIVGLAHGLGKGRARGQTRIGEIELAPSRFLHTHHEFIDTTAGLPEASIAAAVDRLMAKGATVIVASGAFSVEDPAHEQAVTAHCRARGILSTAGCEISQLYGLRARTRTAVINASMLPKMLDTANMTESGVREAGIAAPLMIMRSDGGIMDIEQMRRRPILTMLSGPAAGVAAAMMYAGITDGVFLEVGGTSTDISAIRDGKSLVRSATVGGHRLYLRTLDVRTLGVAGGSVPRVKGAHVTDAGPRSAHLADVKYSAFLPGVAAAGAAGAIRCETIAPLAGDPADYVRMTADGLPAFSVTPTCASNLLGLVPEDAASRGDAAAARAAFAALARHMGRPDTADAPEALADEMMRKGTAQVERTVLEMIEDYELDPALLTLSGGGGGAAAIVPYTAKRMGLPFEIAPNAAVISAIGAALALVRDTIERTVVNPTEADVLRIRKEAEEAVTRMGADAASVEVQIEIDPRKNILRATATGTTEMRTRKLGKSALDDTAMAARAEAATRGAEPGSARAEGEFGGLTVFAVPTVEKRLLGLMTVRRNQIRVIDREGIVRLQLKDGDTMAGTKASILSGLRDFFEKHTVYGDAGRELPDLFVVFRGRIVDLGGLTSLEQVIGLLGVELGAVGDGEPVAAVLRK